MNTILYIYYNSYSMRIIYWENSVRKKCMRHNYVCPGFSLGKWYWKFWLIEIPVLTPACIRFEIANFIPFSIQKKFVMQHLSRKKNPRPLFHYSELLVSNPYLSHYHQEYTDSFTFAFTFFSPVMCNIYLMICYDMYEIKPCNE